MDEATRSAMLRLGPLASLARPHVLGDVDVLPHPEGEAANQRPRLGPSEVPPEWPVVALAENLRPQTPPRGDAQPVRGALPPTVQQATPHQKRPTGRGVRGVGDCGAVPVDGLAKRRRGPPHDRAEEGVRGQLPNQGLYKRWCQEVVDGRGRRGRRGRRPRTEVQRRPTNILFPGGDTPPPPGLVEGMVSPSWTVANVAAATRRFAAHPARMVASTVEHGASRPRRENSSC
jgi:hypothetical protein